LDPDDQLVMRRPRRRTLALLALLVLFLAVALIAWIQRRAIATDIIDSELERRGVRGSYEIAAIGPMTERLENVVIGDPERPDLVARWVEIELSYGLRAPRVGRITARGVRLRGRLVDGKLSLGEVDKLLPPPTGAPFRLPDLDVDLADASMALATPAGNLGLAVEGRGNLADGFEGRLAAAGRGLALGDCSLAAPRALVGISIANTRPRIDGPAQGGELACGQELALRRPVLDLELLLTEGLDGWLGRSRVEAAQVRAAGGGTGPVRGRISFSGDAERTRGRIALAGADARSGDVAAARLILDAAYDVQPRAGGYRIAGTAAAQGLTSGRGALRPATDALRSLGGTPIAPIGAALADAVERAGRALDLRGQFALASAAGGGGLQIERLTATSGSGARLSLSDGRGVAIDLGSGAATVDGRISLAGGGFPEMRGALRQAGFGAPVEGTVEIAPIQAGGARLALREIRFAAAGDGTTRVDTVAAVDGPLDGGHVAGLLVPIEGRFGRGGLRFGERCTPASFRSLRYGTLELGATRLSLCPFERALLWRQAGGSLRGGADVAGLRLAGRLGSSPIRLESAGFRFTVAEPGFSGRGVAIRLGSPGYVNRLDLASLSGRFTRRGIEGRFAGGAGQIANVPLLLSEAQGRWQVIGGEAAVDGAMRVADDAELPRFHPLETRDFRLTLADNRIDADGWLTDPETGTQVLHADIGHALDSGRGRAVLDVPGIRFDPSYQPEELTRLTTGVVALVDGELKGRGEIAWSPEGTTSSGTFSTEKMNLAAAFGPVQGLSTTVHFSDLLGLETPPGQRAEVDLIQAGIDAYDGTIRYQLLPDLRVRVESGYWPFAGGELFLDETVLDFSQPSAKQLTFRVVGMDAAAFVQEMEFSNIAATGTFDGTVPMVFDQRGGRIVRGHLLAREGGGVVSYVGELTDRQLGAYGKLAFDALKSLRYSKLSIVLDGSLEGEFIAEVELDGIARNAPAPSGLAGYAINQLAKIPFEFNITARGPFRSIISMMRSFEDPTALIQSALPAELRDRPTTSTTVQPQESEIVR